jgi:hypothetical protein
VTADRGDETGEDKEGTQRQGPPIDMVYLKAAFLQSRELGIRVPPTDIEPNKDSKRTKPTTPTRNEKKGTK